MRVVAIAATLTACSAVSPSDPTITTVAPASALNREPTSVTITGSDFRFPLLHDIDTGDTDVGGLSVALGDIALPTVAWRGETQIDVEVPAGLAPGTYDVTVSFGGTIGATLPGGFTVTELGAFAPPTLIAGVNDPDASDDDPSLTGDRLELYFNSGRGGGPGGGDIWFSTRASTSDPWGAPAVVPVVNSAQAETTPSISLDGLTLYFASARSGNQDVYVATRASRTAPWSTPVRIAELSSPGDDSGVHVSATGLMVMLTSNRDGAIRIYQSTRASTADPWGTPVQQTALIVRDDQWDPCIADAERLVLFGANVGGLGDLYAAQRASPLSPFDAPVLVEGVNTAADEEDPWISEDLRYLVFVSNVSGVEKIYETQR